MLKSRWVKVLNDLWGNKIRTMLIVLSIAVGLFAVGTIVSAQAILSEGMAESFAAINPSSGTVRTTELFEEDFIQAVRGMRNVEEADARRAFDVQVKIGPDEWINLKVFAVPDYDDMRVNKIFSESGAWPPPKQEILIERLALSLLNAQVGDPLLIELPNEKQRKMRIAGLAHDAAQLPAQIDGTPYGYISFETLKWLGEEYGFNELYVVAKHQTDKEFAQQVVNEVKSKAERNGLTIPMLITAEPGQLPLDDILQAILFLMGTLGLLSLLLSVFLIVNTVSALLTQQKRQIGIMKAIGAQTYQLLGMYLGMVLIYGLIALVLAIPLSSVGARELSRVMATYFNFDLANLSIPAGAIFVQIIMGLMVPVLASLFPFIVNLRISPVEAMSVYTLGKGRFGTGFIDRLLSGANLWFARHFLLRPVLLSLRNIFRSKVRLALTLITLTLGGATFIGVFSVQSALDRTLDDFMQLYNFDSMITFSRPYRIEKIKHEAKTVPGVVDADVYFQLPARRVRPDGSESNTIFLTGFDVRSELVSGPKIVQGRWLVPEDENAIVVDAILMKEEPDLKLGDEIVLKIEGRERPFRVVGVSLGMLIPFSYVNYPYISRTLGNVGRTDAAIVDTERHDEASMRETTAALKAYLERRGVQVNNIFTMSKERTEAQATFAVIIFLLLVMALMLAIVGGLGLMGTMSINVLERTREIGVLRAIGAPNKGVARVFIREGIAIGLISWLFGAILAYPLGKALSDAVGLSVVGTPLNFSYSMIGVWVWLALVVILSALASFIPAQNASRLTVREVLAYE
ncbi:MAG: FtsX-like permease family protein [Anaerolineales bacterium]|nr:FtsX-like permease family protein [Anaerolineales bacterium]